MAPDMSSPSEIPELLWAIKPSRVPSRDGNVEQSTIPSAQTVRTVTVCRRLAKRRDGRANIVNCGEGGERRESGHGVVPAKMAAGGRGRHVHRSYPCSLISSQREIP